MAPEVWGISSRFSLNYNDEKHLQYIQGSVFPSQALCWLRREGRVSTETGKEEGRIKNFPRTPWPNDIFSLHWEVAVERTVGYFCVYPGQTRCFVISKKFSQSPELQGNHGSVVYGLLLSKRLFFLSWQCMMADIPQGNVLLYLLQERGWECGSQQNKAMKVSTALFPLWVWK